MMLSQSPAITMSEFSRTTYRNKYAQPVNGRKDEWPETAERQTRNIVRPYLPDLESRIYQLILERKFIPGGRYLYAAGKKFPQTNNCFLFRAEDSKEGWGDLMHKITISLMTGGG